MKKITHTLALAALFALPAATNAQSLVGGGSENSEFGKLLREILNLTNDVLIPFIIGIGFLVFVWGMFWYFIAGGADEDKRDKGRNLMIYATLGFVLIVVFWGIINLISNTLFERNDIRQLDNIPTVRTENPNS